MATPATRGRGFSTRPKKAYRLEMEGRTLYLLLGLMGATGLVIFYLGIVTGQAMRDPNVPIALNAELRSGDSQAGTEGDAPQAGNLAFNKALGTQDEQIEKLLKENETSADRTRDLLSNATTQLELKEVERSKPGAEEEQPNNTAQTAAQAPEKATAQAPAQTESGRYTVQVAASRNKDSAENLASTLRAKGFSAFVATVKAKDGSLWHRVRVGKNSRDQAEVISSRLRSEAGIKQPKIMRISP